MALVVLAMTGFATPAAAQFDMNLASQMALQRQTMLPMDGARMRSLSLARSRGVIGADNSRLQGPSGPARAFDPHFTRSAQVAAHVRARYVDFVRKTAGPGAAELVAADFRRFDPAAEWSRAMRKEGLAGDTHNMVEAFASYWLLNWAMANQQDVEGAQARGVLHQTYERMSADPYFALMSDAGRQEFADALMCNYLYQQTAFRIAAQKGDRAMLRRLSDAAAERFQRELGMDLRAMRLTPAGLSAG